MYRVESPEVIRWEKTQDKAIGSWHIGKQHPSTQEPVPSCNLTQTFQQRIARASPPVLNM